MLARITVIAAALVIAASAPLRAQAPEQSGPARSGSFAPNLMPNPLPDVTPSRPSEPSPHAAARELRVPAGQIDQVTKDSIRTLDLQTTFPRRSDPVTVPLRIAVPEWLIWIAVALVAAFVLYALRDPLLALLGRRNETWEPPPVGTAEEIARAHGTDALTAADALSRQGRFVEAMHLLLLQSLADIREQLRVTFADSLTSREILRGARLDPAGRTSLREIVAAVERTYFGGYPAQGEDYAACRRNFDALRRILRGGALA